jgi:hypothetical protein
MIIRQQQMERLGEGMLRSFENEMVAHLAAFSPPLFRAVKDEQMRHAIRLGMARAAERGITYRGPIRLYLELMLLFGSRFDTDPQYPWAGEILKDPAPQMDRAGRLYEKTREYRKQVTGAQDAYTLAALRKISALARQELPISLVNFVPDMLQQFGIVYPEKAAYVGENGLKLLIESGLHAAQGFGLSSTPRALTLTVVLMFAFGHGCFEDPLYPWIGETATNVVFEDPDARAKRLERRSLTWLNHVLANFEGGKV